MYPESDPQPTSEWNWSPPPSTSSSSVAVAANRDSQHWPTTRKLALIFFIAGIGIAIVLTLLFVGVFDRPPQPLPLCPPGTAATGKCVSADSIGVSPASSANTKSISIGTLDAKYLPAQSTIIGSHRLNPHRGKPYRSAWM